MRFPAPERSCAVLIGTSTYQDEKLPSLPEVGRSVDDLAAALIDPDFGVVPRELCDVLLDEEDISLIGHKLLTAAGRAEDLLLVYFAGHGLVAGRRHDLYLGLPNSMWASPVFSSLEYEKVRSAVLESRASTKIIILDCCFSGRAVTGTMAAPATEFISQLNITGCYVLAASQPDQVALIIPGEEHTAFTGRLLRLLREGIPGGAEYLTIEDLYQELQLRMKAEGLSQPQKRATDTAGLLPLTKNRASASFALPSLRQRLAEAEELADVGEWEEAAIRFRDVLAELEPIAVTGHPDTLVARLMLAHATGAMGDPAAGAAGLRALLEDLTTLDDADEGFLMLTRQYLAVNLGEAGYRDQAVAILRVLLPDRRRTLGGGDEHTLRTVHILARNLAAMGETDEAVALFKELIAARERVLGVDHPHTARARHDLATLQEPTAQEGSRT